jgi:hypothetical protein
MLISNKQLYEDLNNNLDKVIKYLDYNFPYGPSYYELIFVKHESEEVICMRKTGMPLSAEEMVILKLYK